MASHAPATCCIEGVKHNGTPAGELQTIDGIETYVAQVPSTVENNHKDVAILYLPDVLGHLFPNAQLIADQFAANGYTTYMPDLYHGDPCPWPDQPRPDGFTLEKWLAGEYAKSKKGHAVEDDEPVVKSLLTYLREEKGYKKIGAVGYCLGAKYLIRSSGLVAQPRTDGIDVGFVAHPSLVTEEELQAQKAPLSIAAAYHDELFTPEKRYKSEEILVKLGIPFQVNLYSHVEHGYAVKGDPSKKEHRFAKEKTFLQAVQWFDEYLV